VSHGIVWTLQLDERLRELHGSGMSFLKIAVALNQEFDLELTRNACIGRGRRIGLTLRASPPPRTKPNKPRKKHPRKSRRLEAPPIAPEPEPEPIILGRVTMLQLNRTTCRWPSGQQSPYTYCGEPVHGDRPYCLAHCKLSYQKPEKTWS
jgi:hypothetical protein